MRSRLWLCVACCCAAAAQTLDFVPGFCNQGRQNKSVPAVSWCSYDNAARQITAFTPSSAQLSQSYTITCPDEECSPVRMLRTAAYRQGDTENKLLAMVLDRGNTLAVVALEDSSVIFTEHTQQPILQLESVRKNSQYSTLIYATVAGFVMHDVPEVGSKTVFNYSRPDMVFQAFAAIPTTSGDMLVAALYVPMDPTSHSFHVHFFTESRASEVGWDLELGSPAGNADIRIDLVSHAVNQDVRVLVVIAANAAGEIATYTYSDADASRSVEWRPRVTLAGIGSEGKQITTVPAVLAEPVPRPDCVSAPLWLVFSVQAELNAVLLPEFGVIPAGWVPGGVEAIPADADICGANEWLRNGVCVAHPARFAQYEQPITHIILRTAREYVANGLDETIWTLLRTWTPNPLPYINAFIALKGDIEVIALLPASSYANASAASFAVDDMGWSRMSNFIGMGEVVSADVSDNAMHVWAAFTRQSWEIDAIVRRHLICMNLTNTTDAFMEAKFTGMCAGYPDTGYGPNVPQNASIADFLQYVPLAPVGLYAPGFFNAEYFALDGGWYTHDSFLKHTCEPGYLCQNGVREECPSGYICPDYGTSLPFPCSADPDHATHCFGKGLSAVQACPPGYVCVVPNMPPIPAPPGDCTVRDPKTGAVQLNTCAMGSYCPIGADGYAADHLACPAGAFCNKPSVIAPTACQCGGYYCSYCPINSTVEEPCPAGYYCHTPYTLALCQPSQWCPPGSFSALQCDAGFYCPTPAERYVCPKGKYCRTGSIAPKSCHFKFICPAGSESDRDWLLILISFVTLVFGAVTFVVVHKTNCRCLRGKRPVTDGYDFLLNPAYQTGTQQLVLSFTDITLSVKDRNILNGITGSMRSGRFLAVLGPSGCGKTSLLNVLCGKAGYGKSSGTVSINGTEMSLKKIKHAMGFVPQEDIMLRSLTVQEILKHSARLRLPASYKREQIRNNASAVMEMLGISHIKDSIIGDEEKRGISGGERKRVNIGMELVVWPAILFLDEPTSGLDAATSKQVCACLKNVAVQRNIVVAAVVHQPRMEIFRDSFDDVLLLTTGGRVAYLGTRDQMTDYFARVGYPVPPETNPIDHFLDVVTMEPDHTAELWEQSNEGKRWAEDVLPHVSRDSLDTGLDTTVVVTNDAAEGDEAVKNLLALASRKRSPLIYQLWVFFWRSVIQQIRDWSLLLDVIIVIIAGIFVGMIFINYEYIPALPDVCDTITVPTVKVGCLMPLDDPIGSVAFMSSVAVSMTSIMSSLRIFGSERSVFWREAGSGTSPLMYFLGKLLAHLPMNTLLPLLFTYIVYAFGAPPAKFFPLYSVFLMVQLSFSSLGYVVSIIVPPNTSQMAAVVIVVVMMIFNGMSPSLAEFEDMGKAMKFIPDFSFLRWSVEEVYLINIFPYIHTLYPTLAENIEYGMHTLLRYDIDDYGKCWGCMAGYLGGFTLLSVAALYLWNRPKWR
eukprot:TRINITY_DN5643_c0_g1_i1.p1 TRINITY_DN5643_c0_g1~~TRINITY_DN5643_c0_g1_i1.p1  ORF type:complete len:1460 (-),score=275.74 TRINITY_DN5643_c0_g1_i1:73-4452(-)